MYKFLILLSAALLSAPLSADVVTPSSQVQSFITIWDAPAGNKVGELPVGQYLNYRNAVDSYYEVELGGGETGFVLQRWSSVLSLAQSSPNEASGYLELHFLDAGQGDSTLAVCPDGTKILIDASLEDRVSYGGVNDYLLNTLNGVRRIDHLILTRPDSSNLSLLQESLRGFTFGRTFYLGSISEEDSELAIGSSAFLGATTQLNTDDFDREGQPNPVFNCGEADIYLLAANAAESAALQHNNALTLKIEFKQFAAILVAGESRAPERDALSRYEAEFLNVQLLKTATPWRLATPSATRWIEAVKPEAAVISAGSKDFFGNPWAAVVSQLERYTYIDSNSAHTITTAIGNRDNYRLATERNYDEQIYSTANSGNVAVFSDGLDYWIESSSP